jgi:hypothetical protein
MFELVCCNIATSLTKLCASVGSNCSNGVIDITWDIKGKGKAIPLQASTGPERSRRLRLPDFKAIDT